jgi:hypothetical protein
VAMKVIAEYLEHALTFERMADQAADANLKEQFREQAADYRRLAEKRAVELGLLKPPPQVQ